MSYQGLKMMVLLLLLPAYNALAKPVSLICDLDWSYESFIEPKEVTGSWSYIGQNYLPLGMAIASAKARSSNDNELLASLPISLTADAKSLEKGLEACRNSDFLVRFTMDLETNDLQTQNSIKVERKIAMCYDDFFCKDGKCGAHSWANSSAELAVTPNTLSTETMSINRKTLLGTGGKNLDAYGAEAFKCRIEDIDVSENQI